MSIVRTTEEINEQVDLANESIDNGSKFFGMTYEEGVKATIQWLTGESDEKPMDD